MPGSDRERRKAVALRYASTEAAAPRVIAKGSGHVADRIIAVANEHGVPVREDRDLTALLSQLELDAQIPPELYRAVAEVLAFVYRLGAR